MKVAEIMAKLEAKYGHEKEYLQAVREVLESIEEVYNQHPEFEKAKIVERIVEPDRIFTFRVTWVDDNGDVQTNIGYRVQFNSAIGPYKGGLRFHKAVTPSMLKFLGFEQTFKNSLRFLESYKKPLTFEDVLLITFLLNGAIDDKYEKYITDYERFNKIYNVASQNKKSSYDDITLFNYGLDICLEANRINAILLVEISNTLASTVESTEEKINTG